MKKLICISLLLVAIIFSLAACTDPVAIEISDDGYWVIDGEKTEHKAVGTDDNASVHEHKFAYSYTLKAASCTDEGIDLYSCGDCSLVSMIVTNSLKHNWLDATCTAPITCSACGETDGSALGHQESDWIIDQEATAIECGARHTECTRCSETMKEEIIPVSAEGLVYEINADGMTCTITDIEPTYEYSKVVVPSVIDGYIVTAIGERAFADATSITSIEISDTVKTICNGAFYGCTAITEFTLPESVTSLSAQIFYGCYSLTSVTIHESVTEIGVEAFYGCDNLKNINVTDAVAFGGISISDDTFSNIKYVYVYGEPVENPFYIPSVAVMYIIDTSGSMLSLDDFEGSRLYYALMGTESSLSLLGGRDYIGITSFADEYAEVLELTSLAEEEKIFKALDQLRSPDSSGGSSGLSDAILSAGESLVSFAEADQKHIIIITDGIYDFNSTAEAVRYNYEYRGIETTIIGMEISNSESAAIREMSPSHYHNVQYLILTEDTLRQALEIIKIQ